MEETNAILSENDSVHVISDSSVPTDDSNKVPSKTYSNGNSSNLFPDSPVYEPEDSQIVDMKSDNTISLIDDDKNSENMKNKNDDSTQQGKRKLSNGSGDNSAKIPKLDSEDFKILSEPLDEEVSKINKSAMSKLQDDVAGPSTSRVRTPSRTGRTPKKVSKRSNSSEVSSPRTPKTKSRPASADIVKQRKTPKKVQLEPFNDKMSEEFHIISSDSSTSRPSVEFVKEIPPPKDASCDPIAEESASDLNDSQNFHLVLSPSPEEDSEEKPKYKSNSDPNVVKDREEVLDPGKISQTRSEGYNYSDLSSNLSQPIKSKDYGKDKATDQESTDSMCSTIIDSPDTIPTVTSKLISKLSNGNSSTPTEQALENTKHTAVGDGETPDMLTINGKKGKRAHESFKMSNTNTPSTISPLQNGHSLPINTPHIPTFDMHVSHNEDGEFMSLYIVRTDNDMGMDMYKEYQRFSKRFTIDPYMGDISSSNSPNSVTSTGMISLPNRISYVSTTSSTSNASSRTSDGAFVVPQPPRKSVSHPSSTTVKGCEALMKKIQEVFAHVRESSIDEGNRSTSDEKVSVGIQASPSSEATLSNGNASPGEVSKCDKATPKSSLKKTRVRGRRPLAGKAKRAILPTQAEEPEYMQGINSPEMVPSTSENGKTSPKPSKDDKPLSTLVATPKSVNKLKQKRSRPTSPRPATPVEKAVVKPEYPGYPPGTVVLARWVDSCYYSGKVMEITEPNKYLIKFDDGQSKALLDEFIIFGNKKSLPLQGQSVYAMIDEEQNYEPGLVLEVEENGSGTVTYRCTTDGDTTVSVTASELYLSEDQAKCYRATARPPPPPTTPRRPRLRELDLDNIIQGPRSARSRDKGSSSARKRVASPKSPKASTSGLKSKTTPVSRKRVASESSSISESSNSAPPARLEEVAGVEPEMHKTPRKIDGVKAGPLQLKGAAKQNIGKKNSKLTKFENDEATVSVLGPAPPADSEIFAGMHFLLTCTEAPRHTDAEKESRHYSSEDDSSMAGTDTEELVFTDIPFHKERLREQLQAGGGVVHSHFDDVPKNKYSVCKLIAPRPCLTAKYIQCLAADIRAVLHTWVIASCTDGLKDFDSYTLPAGWSLFTNKFVNWAPTSGKRSTSFFKDKLILLCSDQESFVKFWDRVCTLAGANTRIITEEDMNMGSPIALVTDCDCPHVVQNKANQDNIPLVSTTWVVQCLIETRVIPPTSHDKFSFMYTEPE
ncbi:TP53-binding protein 1 [Plutella xylostella]|uniref:TP53-binding protein 1 n=1 Tax=Plutella xylostella TaxID=51655 RepID=UPI0020324886|nr:TP53-binding protein 1 [Plutella xylostella]